jgi:peptidoglycan/LPS O-acetylase OafA/YrhL
MTKSRFSVLDGVRGVAALLVVLYHLQLKSDAALAPAGYLAVDLFFLLSGFVIAYNYSERMGFGLSFIRFTELRLIRLYPLYAIGLLIGLGRTLASTIAKLATGQETETLWKLAIIVAFNAALLPVPFDAGTLFPLNVPSWSLFYEVAINLVFALVFFRAPVWLLAGVAAAAAAFLFLLPSAPDFFDSGWSWATIGFGVARVTYSFILGVILYRIPLPRQSRTSMFLCLIPIAVLIAPMMLNLDQPTRTTMDIWSVVAIFPLVIGASIIVEAPKGLRRIFAFLGDVSYPLYAIHYPIVIMIRPVLARHHIGFTFAALAALVLLAAAIGKYADEPIRRWLSTRAKLRQSAAPQVLWPFAPWSEITAGHLTSSVAALREEGCNAQRKNRLGSLTQSSPGFTGMNAHEIARECARNRRTRFVALSGSKWRRIGHRRRRGTTGRYLQGAC